MEEEEGAGLALLPPERSPTGATVSPTVTTMSPTVVAVGASGGPSSLTTPANKVRTGAWWLQQAEDEWTMSNASTLHEQQTRRKQYLWQREMLERAVIALIHRVDGRELRSTFSRWQIRAVRSKRVLGAASGLVARLSFADRKAKVVASTMFLTRGGARAL